MIHHHNTVRQMTLLADLVRAGATPGLVNGHLARHQGTEHGAQHHRVGRSVSPGRVQGLVNISDLEADQALQDAALSVFHAVNHTLANGSAGKLIENQIRSGICAARRRADGGQPRGGPTSSAPASAESASAQSLSRDEARPRPPFVD